MCMCEEHEFVMPDNLDDELQTMLQNQTEQWSELKAQLDSTVEVKMNSPPPECAGKCINQGADLYSIEQYLSEKRSKEYSRCI